MHSDLNEFEMAFTKFQLCMDFFWPITLSLLYKQRSDLATGLGVLGVACECCLISKT